MNQDLLSSGVEVIFKVILSVRIDIQPGANGSLLPTPELAIAERQQRSAEIASFESEIGATVREVEGFPAELMTMIIAGAAAAMDTAIQRSLASHCR